MKPRKVERMAVENRSRLLLLVIAYLGFISLGLPDPVAGVAWPSVRDAFALPQSRFGLIFLALGCGYCASGFFGGKLTHGLGLGNLLWISSALVAGAMFASGFAPIWPMMVAAAVVWGLGSGGIDAGLNAYVSSHFSTRHVNWLHACYSLGATLGPLAMTAILVWVGSWRIGYLLVGSVLLGMTILFLITRDHWTEPVSTETENDRPTIGLRVALREPLVWIQLVIFFLYVGLEFTIGQWSYTLLTESRHVSAEISGMMAGAYYAAIGVGRVLSGVIVPRIGLDQLLRYALLTAVIGTGVFAFGSPMEFSNAGLILIGLGLAPVFPCLIARTPARLGTRLATHAVGFQVSSGMLGAALLPGFVGLFTESRGLEVVPQFAMVLAMGLFTTHELLIWMTPSHGSRVDH